MGVRIIVADDTFPYGTAAVLYCSTTMTAFGPLFADREEAEKFLEWLHPLDARTLSDAGLEGKYSDFRARNKRAE
jgi:hypothetical protein